MKHCVLSRAFANEVCRGKKIGAEDENESNSDAKHPKLILNRFSTSFAKLLPEASNMSDLEGGPVFEPRSWTTLLTQDLGPETGPQTRNQEVAQHSVPENGTVFGTRKCATARWVAHILVPKLCPESGQHFGHQTGPRSGSTLVSLSDSFR